MSGTVICGGTGVGGVKPRDAPDDRRLPLASVRDSYPIPNRINSRGVFPVVVSIDAADGTLLAWHIGIVEAAGGDHPVARTQKDKQ